LATPAATQIPPCPGAPHTHRGAGSVLDRGVKGTAQYQNTCGDARSGPTTSCHGPSGTSARLPPHPSGSDGGEHAREVAVVGENAGFIPPNSWWVPSFTKFRGNPASLLQALHNDQQYRKYCHRVPTSSDGSTASPRNASICVY
jgi:hypothetical protein